MKKLLYLLLIPTISLSQENNIRVITKDLDTVFASKMKQINNGETTYLEKINGESVEYDSKDVFSVRNETLGRDYFIWTRNEFTDFVVVEIDSITQQELFNMTINWVKNTYKNPDEVIKTTIDKSKIRIEGYGSNIIKYKGLFVVDVPGKYVIEISFKDGKYKFDPIEASFILDNPIGEVSILISDTSSYYNNRKGEINRMFSYLPISMENLFNNLNSSLFDFIISKKVGNSPNDDW